MSKNSNINRIAKVLYDNKRVEMEIVDAVSIATDLSDLIPDEKQMKSQIASEIITEIDKFRDSLSSRTAQAELMRLIFNLERKYKCKRKK